MSAFPSIRLEHPHGRERAQGARSRAQLIVDRGLKSGKLDFLDLEKADLLRIIEQAAKALQVLEATKEQEG